MPEPHLRAADVDRAAVADVLGAHMSAGRLTVAEFDERLSRAYAAKTYGELDELTADLPPLEVEKAATPVPAQCRPTHPAMKYADGSAWAGGWDHSHSWRSWLTTSLIVLTIWAATSLASWEFHYFWPIWVIGPWGAVLLAQTLTGRDDDRSKRQLPR
jgi:hypothetical protein